MRLFAMMGEVYDDVVTGRNNYMYDDDYDCLYLPVSKEFVNHVLERECSEMLSGFFAELRANEKSGLSLAPPV